MNALIDRRKIDRNTDSTKNIWPKWRTSGAANTWIPYWAKIQTGVAYRGGAYKNKSVYLVLVLHVSESDARVRYLFLFFRISFHYKLKVESRFKLSMNKVLTLHVLRK